MFGVHDLVECFSSISDHNLQGPKATNATFYHAPPHENPQIAIDVFGSWEAPAQFAIDVFGWGSAQSWGGVVAAKPQCIILVLIAVKALERLWIIVWGA